jgi:hypothetical protein
LIALLTIKCNSACTKWEAQRKEIVLYSVDDFLFLAGSRRQNSTSSSEPRPKSEAGQILEQLADIWDTWLPPKAIDSFKRGKRKEERKEDNGDRLQNTFGRSFVGRINAG